MGAAAGVAKDLGTNTVDINENMKAILPLGTIHPIQSVVVVLGHEPAIVKCKH